MLMRFGLCDIRNYDSVELARSLAWFAPLYEPTAPVIEPERDHLGRGVAAVASCLRESGVCAVVAAAPPPERLSTRLEQVGKRLDRLARGEPWADCRARHGRRLEVDSRPRLGSNLESIPSGPTSLVVRETLDPGWTALLDGKTVAIQPESGVFMACRHSSRPA